MKLLTKFLILFFLNFATANAQEIFNNATFEAIKKIVIGTGPVTKQEYNQFWKDLGVTNQSQKRKIIDKIKGSFFSMQQFQNAMWLCAEKSWIKEKVQNCTSAKRILTQIRSRKSAKQAQLASQMQASMEGLTSAAAKREKYQIPGTNDSIQLSLEGIKSNRHAIQNVLNRFSQVLRLRY